MGIREVAKKAGVSVATVSRTVNHAPSVRPDVAAKVWSAISEIGYVANGQARSLVSGRSRILGLIIPDITNPCFPPVVHAFEQIAVQSGFEVLLGSTHGNPTVSATTIRRMIERRVEGVAVMTAEMEGSLVGELIDRHVALVLKDVNRPPPQVSSICVDYLAGMRQAVRHLHRRGHRRLAFISGPLNSQVARMRREAFLQCLTDEQEVGDPPMILAGDHTLNGGCRAAQELLSAPSQATAVICSNDLTAIGVLHGLDAEGLCVPDDISVIGFDDIDMAQFMLPPLTTVRLPRSDLARMAFEALVADIERPADSRGVSYSLETGLIVRGSTRRLDMMDARRERLQMAPKSETHGPGLVVHGDRAGA